MPMVAVATKPAEGGSSNAAASRMYGRGSCTCLRVMEASYQISQRRSMRLRQRESSLPGLGLLSVFRKRYLAKKRADFPYCSSCRFSAAPRGHCHCHLLTFPPLSRNPAPPLPVFRGAAVRPRGHGRPGPIRLGRADGCRPKPVRADGAARHPFAPTPGSALQTVF